MCVIIYNQPGSLIPYDLFENATFNNPHGYGVLVRSNNELELFKGLDESGNDPEKIYKILDEHKDKERYIHLRWKTEGGITEENLHPFEILKNKDRQIYFFHNGTLYKFKSPFKQQWDGGRSTSVPEDDNSDSKNFAEKILTPLLTKFNGENGLGDYNDPAFKTVLEALWEKNSNRGLIVSNDLDPYFINTADWRTVHANDKEKCFFASNTDYFYDVKRGPEADRRRLLQEKQKEEERKKAQKTAMEVNPTNGEVTLISSGYFDKTYSLSETLVDCFEDYDLFNYKEYSLLANITFSEIFSAIKEMDNADVATLFLAISSAIKSYEEENKTLEEKNSKLVEKLERASQHIESMKKREKNHNVQAA